MNFVFTDDCGLSSLLYFQVDCPEDVAAYIHRVGRTARYHSEGRSVLFLVPSETEMLKKLEVAKIPIHLIKVDCYYSQNQPFVVLLCFQLDGQGS